jgi:CheY-like chemotaxis protein
MNQPEPRTYDISDDPKNSKRKTVLLLEDDAEFSAALKEMLEEQGYCVTVVPSGTEGIQRVLVSDFDAILCDMVMPNFPGDMFYRAVERSRPHLNKRFVFMTGHQDNPKVTKFIQDVRGTVLWKPFEMGKLFDALEKVTGRSR